MQFIIRAIPFSKVTWGGGGPELFVMQVVGGIK